MHTVLILAALLTALASAPAPSHAFTIVQGTGTVGTQDAVSQLRLTLGDPNNGINPGPLSTGRREINWDGAVPLPTPLALVGVGLLAVGIGVRIRRARGVVRPYSTR